ncbi:MAG: hypothetical protein HY696_02460 [Deltaproteobacteria bacterium]|nr:hypothetical protein [Deltaproteobacteria bacterium]
MTFHSTISTIYKSAATFAAGFVANLQYFTALQEAKAKLNQLVDAAIAGEDVVLLRHSKIVATIRPLTEADLDVAPALTDGQAKRLWTEAAAGPKKAFRSAKAAAAALQKIR